MMGKDSRIHDKGIWILCWHAMNKREGDADQGKETAQEFYCMVIIDKNHKAHAM